MTLDPIDRVKLKNLEISFGKAKPADMMGPNEKDKGKLIYRLINHTCSLKDVIATLDTSMVDKPIEKGKGTSR